MLKFITIFDDILERISRYGLLLTFFNILFFAVAAIVLRWLGKSVMWIEPMVRHLVFVSAFLGGSLATSKGVHIRVDLLTKLIENSKSKVVKWVHHNVVALFCFVTTAVLFKSSFDFYLMEKEFGAESFLNIHSSTLVAIIPVGLGLISLRFLNQLLLGLLKGEKHELSRL